MKRKPSRTYDAATDAAIIFQPAITPIEAAALPARETRDRGRCTMPRLPGSLTEHPVRERRAKPVWAAGIFSGRISE